MKVYNTYWKAILILCLLASNTTWAQLQKLYVNPKATGLGRQSDIIDSLRFVPLDMIDGTDFNSNTYVFASEKYFMMIDFQDKKLLLFHKNGTLAKKINYKNLGQEFYPNYNHQTNQIVFFGHNPNYSLTSKDELEVSLNWRNPRNKKYYRKYVIDLNDPTFAIKKAAPEMGDIVHAYMQPDGSYWQTQIVTSPRFKDSVDYELKVYKNDQLVKGYFPYNHIKEPRYLYTEEKISFHKSSAANTHLISRPFCDTIYRLVKDSIYPAYQLVMPLENSLPPSFFNQPFKNKTERENFERNNGWMMHQLSIVEETPRHLYFYIRFLSNFEAYIYNKQTNAAYKIKNIKPDSTHYNLPLLADVSIAKSGNKCYKLQKAADLFTYFDQHPNVPVPKELAAFMNKGANRPTHVIVEFIFKN